MEKKWANHLEIIFICKAGGGVKENGKTFYYIDFVNHVNLIWGLFCFVINLRSMR